MPKKACLELQQCCVGIAGIAHAAGSLAWDMHCVGCLAAAASVAMADLVRQVEVGCAQRGRSLALTWNLQTACTEAALSESAALFIVNHHKCC